MPTARGTFETHDWEGDAWFDRDGIALGAAALRKTFSGDLSGTSEVRLLTGTDAGMPLTYVGLEVVDADLAGRRGSFVVQHATEPDDRTSVLTRIVPGSGRGDLAGITGSLRIVITPEGGHEYALDYEIG
jgi:hypothetical protein